MGFGFSNENLAYAILEMIQKEAQKIIANQGVKIISERLDIEQPSYDEISKKPIFNFKFISNILNVLQSYNYSLELIKNDTLNPNLLTSVVITFDENVKEIINLVRDGVKLIGVDILIYTKDDTMKDTENPFNMPTSIFVKYVFNKYKYKYYNDIYNNPNSTIEQKQLAEQKMNEAQIENQNLRNLYNIKSDDYSYDDLVVFLPNPLNMKEEDFIKYCLNKKIYNLWVSGVNINQSIIDNALQENTYLREQYLIEEDVYSYSDLLKYLPNPLGMQKEDFLEYFKIKQQNIPLLKTIQELINTGGGEEQIISLKQQIYFSEQPYRDKYYIQTQVDDLYNVISSEDMSYEEMNDFIQNNKIEDNEILLFKIELSLNYSMGRLNIVNSKLILGE